MGTGPGTAAIELARAAPACRLVGLDVSPRMLSLARGRAAESSVRLPLVCADASRLPFGDSTFDGAVGHSVLYLLRDPGAALAEIRRAVRPGGRVAFLEPRSGAVDRRAAASCGLRFGVSMALWRVMSSLHRRFDADVLAALLARAGFSRPRAWPVLAGFGLVAVADRQ